MHKNPGFGSQYWLKADTKVSPLHKEEGRRNEEKREGNVGAYFSHTEFIYLLIMLKWRLK